MFHVKHPPCPQGARGVFSRCAPAGRAVRRPAGHRRRRPRADRSAGGPAAVGATPAELRAARDRGPPGRTVCDIGSGAGLPGLVLAIGRPDLRVTLVEPLLRRTTFLAEAVEQLALPNVEVVRDRAEALHGRRSFDVVTSRAVAPLDRLARWCLPLVAPGGRMLAMKGSSAADEVARSAGVIRPARGSACQCRAVRGRLGRTCRGGADHRGRDHGARDVGKGVISLPQRDPRSGASGSVTPRWTPGSAGRCRGRSRRPTEFSTGLGWPR